MSWLVDLISSSCTDKVGVDEETANKIVDQKMKQGKLWYYYHCGLCGKFHMTSSEPRKELELRVI